MKTRAILFALLGAALALPVAAQDKIYRCGSEYTNRPPKGADCKVVEGGNVTVIHGYTPAPGRSGASSTDSGASAPGQPRVDSSEQRQRDADARLILESELKRAEARQTELLAAYNNGQPEKIGGEAQNYQKYLDRVAEMKTSIDRNQADIDGIKRELARLAPKP
ncbi:MAG: DUF3450 domain-containing protein [Burkholderiaceae bacterium]|nr:DUF3450 domain-containing protein [Burkholderiaceae bacterium]